MKNVSTVACVLPVSLVGMIAVLVISCGGVWDNGGDESSSMGRIAQHPLR